MAWTTPPTFTPATTGTAADMNIIRDDLNYLKGQTDQAVLSGCLVGRTTNQSLTTATETEINWDAETFDHGGWITVTSGSVTVPASAIPTGYTTVAVDLRAAVNFAVNSTGYRKARINVNGATVIAVPIDANASTTSTIALSAMAVVEAGDVINLEAYQTSGGALNVGSGFLFVGVFKPVA